MKVGTTKAPKWESELWSYVSTGDGEHCPFYGRCRPRKQGSWCISDHAELFIKLLDANPFDPDRYDLVVQTKPGRVFKLLEMLSQSVLKKAQVYTPPVPDSTISLVDFQLPVETRLIPLAGYHGAIWRLKDAWIIQLNRNDPPVRRRLTLFHEAFHILAHGKGTPVFRKRGTNVGSFNELLAEYFAIYTLMPEQWIRGKWAEVKDINRMAEIFDVTKTVMCLRLKCLRLI